MDFLPRLRPPPMTSDESAFCASRLARHLEQHFAFCGYCGAIVAALAGMGVLLGSFGAATGLPPWLHATLLFLTAGLAAGTVRLAERYPVVRRPQLVYELVTVAYIGWCLRLDLAVARATGQVEAGMLSATGFLIVIPLSLVLSPHRAWTTRAKAIGYALAAVALMWPFLPDTLPWIMMVVTSLCATAAYKEWLLSLVVEEALSEVRTLMQIAPASVVRQSGASSFQPEDLFGVEVRPCLCLSSDWRGFQRVASREAPQAIAASLSEYYTMCTALLRHYFPDGNYYADWIADELFVVVYGAQGTPADALIPSSLDLARELLNARYRFSVRHGYPLGADVGVALGAALVGMIGVPGFSKASALGDVPNTARRRQIEAKGLRTAHGQRDRIVFDADVARHVPAATQLSHDPTSQDLLYCI